MELEELHERYFLDQFEFPELDPNVDIYVPIRDENTDLVTVGMAKKLYEVIFVSDMLKSPYKRMKSIITATKQMEIELKKINAEQAHCFVQDRTFGRLLVERFGFELCKGIPLVKNLG